MGFRDKANDVYRQGEIERGRFNPTGAPLKVYQYRPARAEYPPERENFCHFWRVVVIWAPLMFIRRPIAKAVQKVLPQGSTIRKAAFATGRGIAAPFKFVSRQISKIPGNVRDGIAIGVFVLYALILLSVVIGSIFFAVHDLGFWTALLAIAIIVSAVLTFLGVVYGLSLLSEHFREKRIAKERERREAYYNGEISGDEYFAEPPKNKVVLAVGNFFRGVGDFLILGFNIVRVNKWKICPLVEIPKDEVDTRSPVV